MSLSRRSQSWAFTPKLRKICKCCFQSWVFLEPLRPQRLSHCICCSKSSFTEIGVTLIGVCSASKCVSAVCLFEENFVKTWSTPTMDPAAAHHNKATTMLVEDAPGLWCLEDLLELYSRWQVMLFTHPGCELTLPKLGRLGKVLLKLQFIPSLENVWGKSLAVTVSWKLPVSYPS